MRWGPPCRGRQRLIPKWTTSKSSARRRPRGATAATRSVTPTPIRALAARYSSESDISCVFINCDFVACLPVLWPRADAPLRVVSAIVPSALLPRPFGCMRPEPQPTCDPESPRLARGLINCHINFRRSSFPIGSPDADALAVKPLCQRSRLAWPPRGPRRTHEECETREIRC